MKLNLHNMHKHTLMKKTKSELARHSLDRLDSFVDAVAGKRITYKKLTASDEIQ